MNRPVKDYRAKSKQEKETQHLGSISPHHAADSDKRCYMARKLSRAGDRLRAIV